MKNQLDQEMSLVSILRSDPLFSDRIKQVSEKIKKDKNSVLSAAEKYNRKYHREIEEGTRQKQLLLNEGSRRGMSPDETLKQYGRFLPTVHTPILNWLHFFMEEEKDTKRELLREQQNKKYGDQWYDKTEYQTEDVENADDMMTYLYGNLTVDNFNVLKKLKRLSKSTNENEAFQAYRKCIKLCEQYGLEFDKIPT